MPTIHLLIKGKVQGVFFRATANEVAQSLELKGWVRNTKDGNVEAVASGNKEALQQFIGWCKKGPEKAVVTSVEATAIAGEEFDHFRVIR